MSHSSASYPDRSNPIKVGVFVTCLVDLFRPSVGFATVKLLEQAGCEVYVPRAQTCCGQPSYNSGDRADTRDIARQVIEAFSEFDYVVAPSGSCAAMIKKHYPSLFGADYRDHQKAQHLADKTHELVSFLTDIMHITSVESDVNAHITYHDSCSGLRELGIHKQPRALLNSIENVKISELKDANVCCGFGGTFCVKYSDISNAIVTKKTENIKTSGAEVLTAGDMGCLMNMAGKLKREGSDIEVRHVAEILAGHIKTPPIAGS